MSSETVNDDTGDWHWSQRDTSKVSDSIVQTKALSSVVRHMKYIVVFRIPKYGIESDLNTDECSRL